MCGIAGFSISNNDHRKVNSRRLSRALLLQIVSRGRDATGAAWSETTDDGLGIWYTKAPVPAGRFVPTLEEMPQHTRTAILHTRWATKGHPDNNANNHPIVVPSVIGVHNGHIANDDYLFQQLGWERTGEVDSEAIFRLIAHYEDPVPHFNKLRGRAAIAWYNTDDPATLHLARISGSPLWIGQTRGGSTIFASEQQHLRKATLESNLVLTDLWEAEEWTYIKIRNGVIHEAKSFDTVAA